MDDHPLRLFNSLTRSIEPFMPVREGEARVYSCGPTVYNYPHIGNMRAYIFADTLGRALSARGLALRHVINITDVGHLTDDADAGEDKLERMAATQARTAWDIAAYYTAAFKADFAALNCRPPATWSVATDYVPQMIEWAKAIEAKHCYRLESGLYFDTSTVPDYGALARARTDAGESRIDPVAGKRSPLDFAIWRTTPAGETRAMEWSSPWGRGAPGWHLECSVMSGSLLGFPFDIHTGGIDHREIHHPCEIAQNQAHEGSADTGARLWMHNNFLIDRTGKMSKSNGDFLRLQTLVDRGFHPLAYRMLCLQAHYRSELEFSWEGLSAAFVRLKRTLLALAAVRARRDDDSAPVDAETWRQDPTATALMARFDTAIAGDLNTADALTALDELVALKKVDVEAIMSAVRRMDTVFGLELLGTTRADLRVRPTSAKIEEGEIEALLAERRAARAARDFARSDALRDALNAAGVEAMDGDPLGWDWRVAI